jgi:glutathione S-transferase
MSQFVVHATPGSPYARAVMAALEEKGANWRLAALKPGTSRQQPHVSHHPFGRMPVLDHGAFSLYETQAILRYLDRILPSPALTPVDAKAAARMDQVMNIVTGISSGAAATSSRSSVSFARCYSGNRLTRSRFSRQCRVLMSCSANWRGCSVARTSSVGTV